MWTHDKNAGPTVIAEFPLRFEHGLLPPRALKRFDDVLRKRELLALLALDRHRLVHHDDDSARLRWIPRVIQYAPELYRLFFGESSRRELFLDSLHLDVRVDRRSAITKPEENEEDAISLMPRA